MQVSAIDTLHAHAGWRNYHYLKLTTTDGVVGWAEYDEGVRAPGVTGIIDQLIPHVLGQDAFDHEARTNRLRTLTRPAPGSTVGMAIGAIENALLDAKARALGVPCYALLGGKIRDRIRVYWSHCGTWRISMPRWYEGEITGLDDVRAMGAEVRDAGFTALKTNVFTYDADGRPAGWLPGFGRPVEPGLNVERAVLRDLRAHLEAFAGGAGPDVDILVDLNFNARTEGYLRIVRELSDLDLFWIEIDHDSADGLARIRDASGNAISSGETLFGIKGFLPYLRAGSMDVGIVDTIWNGTWQGMKIAAAAEAHEVNVAPHNYYGHLCTLMSAHFAAAVPNLRIMETDIDRLPWDDDLVSHAPVYESGELVVPDRPGWGTVPDEDAIAAHAPDAGRDLAAERSGRG